MKFMKLGTKTDSFQMDANNFRYVATELAADIVINVGDVKFCLHKFPLLSKSAHLKKLVSAANEGNINEIYIDDIPGGPTAFEMCAKFCYGMTFTLNASNVIPTRCAAEYLGMYETIDKGNLIYKIDAFLSLSIFRSWKDSIVVLQTAKPFLPICEELKIISRGIDAIASRASVDVSIVDWSYTYNRKKLPEENRNDQTKNFVRSRVVPKDWWVEDLCELDIDLYKRVIYAIKSKGVIPQEVIGEALKAYAWRRLPGFVTSSNQRNDASRYCVILETIVWLLPAERGCVSCSFLLKLLKVSLALDSSEVAKKELVKRIGQQLEEATVNDLLIQAQDGEATMYNVSFVHKILKEFSLQDQNADCVMGKGDDIQEVRMPGILMEASKQKVGKLIDGYLFEIAKDPHLQLSSFANLADMISGFDRTSHDGLYRAIDMYLKEHPDISKSERKRICKSMDCKKLSADACMHAVQNERLPMRIVVQVLFFEQVRAAASSGSSTPDLPKAIKDLKCASMGSSRSATMHTEEDWDGLATGEQLRELKGELAAMKLANGRISRRNSLDSKSVSDKTAPGKMKSLIMTKKLFSKIWAGKGGPGENSSDSSESLGSANHEEIKSSPLSRRGRHSVS